MSPFAESLFFSSEQLSIANRFVVRSRTQNILILIVINARKTLKAINIFLHITEAGSLYVPQALKSFVTEYLNMYFIDDAF